MRAHAIAPLDFIMIDHFHLIQPDTPKGRKDLEMSASSKSLMALPKLFGCPVIQAAQLNRKLEIRQDKRPQLADLRESGATEEDSYSVIFLYRDEYYNPETSERPNIAEVSIAKHRNGPTGTVDLFWHGKLATFRNLQRTEVDL